MQIILKVMGDFSFILVHNVTILDLKYIDLKYINRMITYNGTVLSLGPVPTGRPMNHKDVDK